MNLTEILNKKGLERHQLFVKYLKSNFSNVLGDDVKLLDIPGGIEIVKWKYANKLSNTLN